ncbi:MAG: hypothetical protein IT326_01715 [Anaerolineae bacterium]|nr:hypothetical protein [Anaerolineae bacterium]
MVQTLPFDPNFDDCAWTDAWLYVPVMQLVPGVYPAFTVHSWRISEADLCGQVIRLNQPLDVRGLVLRDGRLWMSDVPQERLMMFNNAARSRGRVLVGGLGIGLYPQYALPLAEHMTIVERDADLIPVVEPVVRAAAAHYQVPLEIITSDITETLEATDGGDYDTIFLDTWETLDPVNLPAINALRDRAISRLRPDGTVLLWGYRWMLRLFQQACEQLLALSPIERRNMLDAARRERPAVGTLLGPVAAYLDSHDDPNHDEAVAWYMNYILRARLEDTPR